MGLLLCKKEAVHPFYYEKLERKLWSLPELCYILYRYPIVIPEYFVDERLCQWLEQELDEGFLAGSLRNLLAAGESQEVLLLRLLRGGNYYKEREILEFQAVLKRLRDIERANYQELLGDTFFRIGRYGRAVEAYSTALAEQKDVSVKLKLADSLVMVMQFRRAARLYEEVYRDTQRKEALRSLFLLEKLDAGLKVRPRYMNDVVKQDMDLWNSEFSAAEQKAEKDDRVVQLSELLSRGEETFSQVSAELIREWKKEYREKA